MAVMHKCLNSYIKFILKSDIIFKNTKYNGITLNDQKHSTKLKKNAKSNATESLK